MENLFGLPAHPLVVHGAVVLVPLAAIGTVLIAVSARLRQQLGVAVAVLAVVAFGFTLLAKQSGEPLEEKVDETEAVEEHAEMGEIAPVFAGLLMVTSVGLVGLDRYRRRAEASDAAADGTTASAAGAPSWLKPAATGLAVLAVVSSVAATTQVVLVGHSGAEATWEEEVEGGEGDEGEDREHEDDEEDEEGMGAAAQLDVPPPVVAGPAS